MSSNQTRRPVSEIPITVVEADALTHTTDVLVLKYAQHLYGADAAAFDILTNVNLATNSELPHPGGYKIYDSLGNLGATQVVFIGVLPLRAFDYKEIRQFGQNTLRIAARECSKARSIALTVHGPGYGLDEVECFESLVAGLLDALTAGNAPVGLQQIAILERVNRRAKRFRKELDRLLGSTRGLTPDAVERLRTVGYASGSKPLLFVAMPFRDDMADLYDYGIRLAAERAGFLCERADQAHFTGDILDWVRTRIEASTLVVADLSFANPNVYLEVGYAWGRGKPTVLMVRETEDVKFDVRGQRCLVYKRIKDLEDRLYVELLHLKRS